MHCVCNQCVSLGYYLEFFILFFLLLILTFAAFTLIIHALKLN